ncbi:hypothetical protein SAICODRAFT_18380 [Saitoella complicata NRRL Y-17804]|uniref:Sister chromatid cohesion protein n=1 Tax=Saitoella complicata (strain BCRC 22490 / CBS 7301 / JCM 7358 / NBRC 10748 / NRRL Y-17804) TaxID=698492 RepID=A0A0E9NAY5_SAICN|nr:uncharacterized protein SAICODRAFT_18380 [Saitoella complicata NRRL Y-17804]ODQ53807.1 hypothetical protein SAICODRAFT_18380 [Saitoella complicata NRRL Y-17804]GAO46994.1 hypothetical protein G7K_1208-t1 [Saitoella complicata NRRL Y-17804]
MNGHSQQQNGYGQQLPFGPLDIVQAMQYTPLTSIIPAAPITNIFPIPTSLPLVSTRLTLSPEEQAQVDAAMEVLNRTQHTSPEEAAFAKAKGREVGEMLREASGMPYQVQLPPLPHGMNGIPGPTAPLPQLDRFAEMLLQSTAVAMQPPPPPPPPPATAATPDCASTSIAYSEYQHAVKTSFMTPLTSLHTTPAPASQPRPVVLIPSPPPHFTPEQYRHTPVSPAKSAADVKEDVTTPTRSPKKRKETKTDKGQEWRVERQVSVPEREKADAAVLQFVDLIGDIFEADDAFEPTEGGDVSMNGDAQMMWVLETIGGTEPCLAMDMQLKVQRALRKVTAAGRLGQISVEELTRLQKISVRSVRRVEEVRLDMGLSEAGEDVATAWIETVGKFEGALRGAIFVLEIMTGRPDERQIISEDLLITIIECLRGLLENAVTPLVEGKPATEKNPTFQVAYACKKSMLSLLQSIVTTLSHIEALLPLIDISDSVINPLLFTAASPVFLDNILKDKEAIFNSSSIEGLRVASMEVLRGIFAKYADQRTFILDEVLTGLSKLPVNKQSARQYRLSGGQGIQLVTALIMKLVHTSGVAGDVEYVKVDVPKDEEMNGSQGAAVEKNDEQELLAKQEQAWTAAQDAAGKIASYVISFYLQKVMKTKTAGSDSPYKGLFDIFVEDLITVLTCPEWPAAELMLTIIVRHLISYFDDDKQGAQIKGIALDTLGSIASKIKKCDVDLGREIKTDTEVGSSKLGKDISGFVNGSVPDADRIGVQAELAKVTLGYLHSLGQQDVGYKIAYGYVAAKSLLDLVKKLDQQAAVSDELQGSVMELVADASDPLRKPTSQVYPEVSNHDLEVLHLALLSTSPLASLFDVILNRMIHALEQPQVTGRQKALRGLGNVINVDASILAGPFVREHIAKRLADSSPLVRNAAVDLVGKYLLNHPELARHYYAVIIMRSNDVAPSVRKSVIKIMRDLYTTGELSVKIEVSVRTLARMQDEEDPVKELATKQMQDLWLGPIEGAFGEHLDNFDALSLGARKVLRERIDVIVRIVEDKKTSGLIKAFIEEAIAGVILDKSAKGSASDYMTMLKLMVQCLFEQVLEAQTGESTDQTLLPKTLATLALFAGCAPVCFSAGQIKALQPFVLSAGKEDQSALYQTLIVYRNVIPALPPMDNAFLKEVETTLLKHVTKVAGPLLKEMIPCLCNIVDLLDDYACIATVVSTCLATLDRTRPAVLKAATTQNGSTAAKLMELIGYFARYSNMDKVNAAACDGATRPTIANIKSSILAFYDDKLPLALHRFVLQSFGQVCIGNSTLFLDEQTIDVLDKAFGGANDNLKIVILATMKEHLEEEERRNNEATMAENTDGQGHIDRSVLRGDTDKFATHSISPGLMQRYLKVILDSALSKEDAVSTAAVQVLNFVVRQGLANPRECFSAILALETSSSAALRNTAIRLHHELNDKHASLIDSCYKDGLAAAYHYQRKLNADVKGYRIDRSEFMALIDPMYVVVKANRQGRKKFLTAAIKSLDVDPTKLTEKKRCPEPSLTKFIAENFAYLDYSTTEEVHLVIYTVDRIMSVTGMSLLAINEGEAGTEGNKAPKSELVKCAMILSALMMLKTFLKQLYGLTEAKCRAFDGNKMGTAKNTQPATRQAGANLQLSWDSLPAAFSTGAEMSEEEQIVVQQTFAQLLQTEGGAYQDFLPVDEEDDESVTTAGDRQQNAGVNENGVTATPKKRRTGTANTPSSKRNRKSFNLTDPDTPSKRKK